MGRPRCAPAVVWMLTAYSSCWTPGTPVCTVLGRLEEHPWTAERAYATLGGTPAHPNRSCLLTSAHPSFPPASFSTHSRRSARTTPDQRPSDRPEVARPRNSLASHSPCPFSPSSAPTPCAAPPTWVYSALIDGSWLDGRTKPFGSLLSLSSFPDLINPALNRPDPASQRPLSSAGTAHRQPRLQHLVCRQSSRPLHLSTHLHPKPTRQEPALSGTAKIP